jgi:hypothetical protein
VLQYLSNALNLALCNAFNIASSLASSTAFNIASSSASFTNASNNASWMRQPNKVLLQQQRNVNAVCRLLHNKAFTNRVLHNRAFSRASRNSPSARSTVAFGAFDASLTLSSSTRANVSQNALRAAVASVGAASARSVCSTHDKLTQ